MTGAMDKMCMNVTELSETLGISRALCYDLVKRDDFPSIEVNRRIIIPVSGLRKWLDDNGGKK